jgi:hypothetical protein
MPPIKRTKALFFPSFHIGEGARNGHSGAVGRGRSGVQPRGRDNETAYFERSFISDSASLK